MSMPSRYVGYLQHTLFVALIAAAGILMSVCQGWSSSLIYKNYIIRYDRGWDIMCEPYQVRQGDWVLKIFRQKGELAHQDFREFLDIFQRLNPHIRDIDMIRPGQTVDIPLRKLEHGTLPGQSSGVVTIPFVALNKEVEKVLAPHVESYQVQWGDTVSKLISRRFGRFGSAAYNEGVELFKAANPGVTDLNRIYAGQKLYIPDPAAREATLMAAAEETPDANEEAGADEDGRKPEAAPVPVVSSPPGPSLPGAVLPAPKPITSALEEAAALVGGTFNDKGTRYIPRQGQDDFQVDMSQFPLLQLENTSDVVFSQSNTVMGVDPAELESFWKDTKVVTYNEDASVEEIVDAIFKALQDETVAETIETAEAAETGFEDGGVRIVVHAKYIRSENDGRRICILPIDMPSQGTPETLRRYLEQHDIVLKEVLPGGKPLQTAISDDARRHAIPNILDLTPTTQKEFVHHLAKALNFNYTPNVSVSFPYAGVMVEAYSNLLSTGDGREILVDFGDLYGDALVAIRKSGPVVVQVAVGDDYDRITRKLLSGLGLAFEENPIFPAADRPVQYNTMITVAGVLMAGTNGRNILLTGTSLHAAVTDLITANGVAIVQW